LSQTPLTGRLSAFFGLAVQIITVVFFARVTIDIGTRLLGPFIPQFAAGLGLTIVGFSWFLFVRALAGIAGPLAGIMADRYGPRRLMAAGLVSQAIGVTGLAFAPRWWALVPMVFYGFALAAFIPAQQSYISAQVAYRRRGRALATIELSWAVAGILALPAAGWLIDGIGWRAPLLLLGLASLLLAGLVWVLLPRTPRTRHVGPGRLQLQQVLSRPGVLVSVLVATVLFLGAASFGTLWSIWLSADFGLTAVGLGLVATAIGLAELAGSVLSGLLIDRVGKRRGSIAGLLYTAVVFSLLLPARASLATAVIGIMLLGVGVEFTIVSLIPLYSEQAPEARATVFSLVGVGTSIGVAVAAPLTASLWNYVGLWAVCGVGVASFVLAAGLAWRFLQEGDPDLTGPAEPAAG
jgi:predicted MFS family arabinose efflux permease